MSATTTKEFTVQENQGRQFEIRCIQCKLGTEHKIVTPSFRACGSYEEENWSLDWQDDYQILQCSGCKSITFRHNSWCSDDADAWQSEGTETLYPRRDARTAVPFGNVPETLARLYREVVDCFNSESPILCAAGLRALVEGLCTDCEIGDGPVPKQGGGTRRADNLEGKIYGLHEKGFVTAAGAEFLHAHRFLGNDAVHALSRPPRDELGLALDIVEHMLEQVYEIPAKAASLKQARALRRGTI